MCLEYRANLVRAIGLGRLLFNPRPTLLPIALFLAKLSLPIALFLDKRLPCLLINERLYVIPVPLYSLRMADAADPTIFVPPPQVRVPPVRTIASVPDPEDPYQLETQLIMEDALIYDRWAGLSQVIYSIALSEKGRTSKDFESSWDKLCSDATSGNNYVYHLLR